MLKLTFADKIMEACGWGLICLLWGLVVWVYSSLPDIIPVHFDISGNADAYGGKMTLFFLPVIVTLMAIGLTVLNLYPHKFNYPVTISADNALIQYTYATRMIRVLKLMIALLSCGLIYFIYKKASGAWGQMQWFLPVALLMIILPLGYYAYSAFSAGGK